MADHPILIDNNALVDFFVGVEELKQDAEKLRRKFPVWITTPLCRYEFGNVLKSYVRRGFVSEDDGLLMLRQGLKMVSFCSECAEEVIFSEANASRLTFYDATYVACGRQLDYRLYTRDKEILEHCPEMAYAIADA
jgi:predicted nucleic acid-binding protein